MVVGIEMLCSRDVTTAVCLRQYAKMLKLSSPEGGRKRRHLIEADSNLSFATTFVKGPSASAALRQGHLPGWPARTAAGLLDRCRRRELRPGPRSLERGRSARSPCGRAGPPTPAHPLSNGPSGQHQIYAHAQVLVEHAGAVVTVGKHALARPAIPDQRAPIPTTIRAIAALWCWPGRM
jgi:hypothetical protein